MRNVKAIILAGGKGLRLREVVNDVPKPMAQIAGRPFLEYLILQLARYDIKEIILSIGYKGDTIRSYFGNGRQWGVQIAYSEEDEPLGTGGALRKASQMVGDEQFVVMNGDSFLDVDFARLFDLHYRKHAMATIALAYVKDVSRYGKVELDEKGGVQRFIEKNRGGEGLINGGVYVFQRRVVDRIPDGNVSLENDILPLHIGQGLYAMRVAGFFVDIGVPEDYLGIYREPDKLFNSAGINK